MTNKNNKRFANRETILKGETVNLETLERSAFEITVPYVRSMQKALEVASEKLELNDDTIINPKKFEVINEAPKPIKYNNGKIYELAYNRFDTEDEAIEAAKADVTQYRKTVYYEISGQVWAFDESTKEYITEFYADETPINMTKRDMREFLRMSYESYRGSKAIGLHNIEKVEKPMYCVITSANLEKCIEA